jgi:hypothetical protein
VAERLQPAGSLERGETPEATARDVLEEDALDRILRAEREDLLVLGLLQLRHRRRKL